MSAAEPAIPADEPVTMSRDARQRAVDEIAAMRLRYAEAGPRIHAERTQAEADLAAAKARLNAAMIEANRIQRQHEFGVNLRLARLRESADPRLHLWLHILDNCRHHLSFAPFGMLDKTERLPDGTTVSTRKPDRRPEELVKITGEGRGIVERMMESAPSEEEIAAELDALAGRIFAIGLPKVSEFVAQRTGTAISAQPQPATNAAERVQHSVMAAYGATEDDTWTV